MSDEANAAPKPSINVEKAETVNAAAPFDQPSAQTRDWIWRLIVGSFCAALELLVVAMIVSMFVRPVSDTIVGLVHGIALLIIGYVAGLMQRSPQHS